MIPCRRAQPSSTAIGTTPDLKEKALRQIAVVGVARIGAEIPGPYLQLVCCDLPSRPSLSIVGSSLSCKELLADLGSLGSSSSAASPLTQASRWSRVIVIPASIGSS